MPFDLFCGRIHEEYTKVFGANSGGAFEDLLRQLGVFLTAMSGSDAKMLKLTKREQELLPIAQSFLTRIIEKENPWARSPNYLLSRTLLYLRYHHYNLIELAHPSLDLGSGDGRTSDLAFDHVFTVGIDRTLNDVKQSLKLGRHRHVACADARDLPLPNETFQTVLSNHTLYHIRDKARVLGEVSRVMKPGGLFCFDDITGRMFEWKDRAFLELLTALGNNSISDAYKKHFHALYEKDNAWDSPLAPSEMCDLLERSGFTDISYEFFLSKENAKLGWFVYDMSAMLQRELYYYFSDGAQTQYHSFVFDRLAKLIVHDREACRAANDGNYVFYKARKK